MSNLNTINVGYEDANAIDLHYRDIGVGRPVVFIHGWPLGSVSWQKQIQSISEAGYRVIAYDRRGFGDSSQPNTGYDFDTFAEDLHQIITVLDLRDLTLVGFAMGCGEVARYLGTYGSERVRSAVFICALPPYLLKTDENQSGLQASAIEGFWSEMIANRANFLRKFLLDFCYDGASDQLTASDTEFQRTLQSAIELSSVPALHSIATWLTDFRDDLRRISIPTLIIHGDCDRVMPMENTAIPLASSLATNQLEIIKGGAHGLPWTHSDIVNSLLLDFADA